MITVVARYGLGIVLVLAVLGKVRHFAAFGNSLAAFGLSGRLARAGAFTVVTVEALAALVAFSPVADPVVGVLGTALGLGFTAAQTYLLMIGDQSVCLCFGPAERVSLRTWGRAALVLVLGLAVWI
ncbi:MauE/DoxX family redox-associated membrane protein [Nonomuraea sp. NPDC050556]|uniref:MauE/DoxX family redox-associated membrane protein n=1 Tax=Nonomuraea sp. NPDC050556 TaxID=3364369 RepID=UPI00379DA0A9